MKLRKFLAFGLMACSVAFIGCDKEEDNTDNGGNGGNNGSGSLTMGSVTFPINDVALALYGDGSWHQGYNIDLIISAGDWEIVEDTVFDGYEVTEEGNGAEFYAEAFTTDSVILEDGTYTFNDSSMAVMTFDYADYEYISGTDTVDGTIVSGTIEVDYSNNSYVMTVTTVDGQGNNVTASYSGGVDIYDFTGKAIRSNKKKRR